MSVSPVGVIPAAGRATRLQPLDGSKELLEVGGLPVLDYLLARLRRAGCEEIRLVTRPEKLDVVEAARQRGLVVVLGTPRTAGASLALGVEGLAGDTTAAFGFPDTIWEPEDGFVAVLAALDATGVDVALGLFRTPDAARSDVVILDDAGFVRAVEAKPAAPGSDLIWGCAAAPAAIVAQLGDLPEPAQLFDRLALEGRVRGVFLSDSWIDIGTPEALGRTRAGKL